MENATLRVGLLAGHHLLRELLSELLTGAGLEVTISTADPAQFAARVASERPEVALLVPPLERPGSRGPADLVQSLRTLKAVCPGCRLVVLAGEASLELTQRIVEEGVQGILPAATTGREALLSGLRAVASGERVYPADLARALGGDGAAEDERRLALLTPRQLQVLSCVGVGHDNATIARLLGITERTVKSHMAALYRHLGVESRVQLALLARRHPLEAGPEVSSPLPAPTPLTPADGTSSPR